MLNRTYIHEAPMPTMDIVVKHLQNVSEGNISSKKHIGDGHLRAQVQPMKSRSKSTISCKCILPFSWASMYIRTYARAKT